jgi:hypothetical protein
MTTTAPQNIHVFILVKNNKYVILRLVMTKLYTFSFQINPDKLLFIRVNLYIMIPVAAM